MEKDGRHWSPADIKKQGLQTKFKFAPSAACIYVADQASVGPVTKILMKELGRTKNGEWPDWGNGSSMRFFPLKGKAIEKGGQLQDHQEKVCNSCLHEGEFTIFGYDIQKCARIH